MDPRLRLHNAVIGMAHPNPPWPQPLADAGYRIARIEQPVGTRLSEVVVDLLLVADERNALLAIECKEGTVQAEQARKYDAMEPLDVVQTGGISIPDPTAAVLDVAYAVEASRTHTTVAELDALSLSAGVLAIGPTIEWHRRPPRDPRLRAVFSAPIAADLRAIPRLLLVDDASHPAMLAAELANQLHAVVEEGRESITVDALIENACWGWARYGRAMRGQFRRGVQEMLREAERNELSGLIRVERAGRQSDPTIRLTAPGSTAATQAGALRESRALRAKLSSFVARVTGKPLPEALGQLSLEALEESPEEEDGDEDE
jgi:hypothetical protein